MDRDSDHVYSFSIRDGLQRTAREPTVPDTTPALRDILYPVPSDPSDLDEWLPCFLPTEKT